jgi:hypothetical protein
VKEPEALLRKMYDSLLPGGSIGIADLDREDGAFHEDHAGVYHDGFDRADLQEMFESIGFRDVRSVDAAVTKKDFEGRESRDFQVFLMIGRKPEIG